jgi:hypothetical protein
MSKPLVFITTHTINEGQLDAVKELSKRFADQIEASDTGLLGFHFLLSDDGREVSNVQLYGDADAMDAYLPVAGELIAEALTLTKTNSIAIYGRPGPVTMQVIKHNEELGATVTIMPDHLGGFTRVPTPA